MGWPFFQLQYVRTVMLVKENLIRKELTLSLLIIIIMNFKSRIQEEIQEVQQAEVHTVSPVHFFNIW